MKELAEDFKTIAKKDRGLFWWMAAQLALAVWLFLLPLTNLNPNRPKVWARYSDINNGYAQSDWWYLISFSVIAFKFLQKYGFFVGAYNKLLNLVMDWALMESTMSM